MPNRYPYNELLFSGKLSAKTRSWAWKHTGLTLLYTSTKSDDDVADIYDLPEEFESGVIVGCGILLPVRENSTEELAQLEEEFHSPDTWIYPQWQRYEFKDLKKFKNPVKFKPPKGAVSVFNIPHDLVREELEGCEIK